MLGIGLTGYVTYVNFQERLKLLRLLPFSQFTAHLTTLDHTSSFSCKDAMGDDVKGFTEIKLDHAHSFPVIYVPGYILIKGYQVGQAQLSLGEAMLTAPNDPSYP